MPVKQPRPRKQPKLPDSSKWKPHNNDSWIFISNAIDSYGLNVYEFRVLAHVARRASTKGTCNASQKTIAECCGINQRKVMEALKMLCDLKILKVTRTGRANEYRLNRSEDWERPTTLVFYRLQPASSTEEQKEQV